MRLSEMYAIIRTGGKQYRVEPGSVLEVERLEADEGASIELGEVLLIEDGNGQKEGSRRLTERRRQQWPTVRSEAIRRRAYPRRHDYPATAGHAGAPRRERWGRSRSHTVRAHPGKREVRSVRQRQAQEG